MKGREGAKIRREANETRSSSEDEEVGNGKEKWLPALAMRRAWR
jgi:hypothetical protein